MNTRFSPSLNGSLHLGHLYMAWINRSFAHAAGGAFILRFDDIAPRMAGEDLTKLPHWAEEADAILREGGIAPDRVSYLSTYVQEQDDFPKVLPTKNQWLRPHNFETQIGLACSPFLVAARVRADIAEEIGAVIRGEELHAELQLYEYFNHLFGSTAREMIFLPRLKVEVGGELHMISKTHGNLQLRDLFVRREPSYWVERIVETALIDASQPFSLDNLHRDPVFILD